MKNSFHGALILFGAFTVFSWIRFVLYQHQLAKYLLKNHTEKWKELTTILGNGPGYANSYRGFKFLFGKEYLDDPEVLRLKVIVRNSIMYFIGGSITTFFTFLSWFVYTLNHHNNQEPTGLAEYANCTLDTCCARRSFHQLKPFRSPDFVTIIIWYSNIKNIASACAK